MLSKVDNKIGQKLKNRIEKIIPILDFKIFGSRARGDHSEYSDLDVYIEVKDITAKQRHQICEIAGDIGFDEDRVITTFVATRRQLLEGPLGADPIIATIEKEGISI